MEKQIEERVELSDVISYATRDWEEYLDECHESEIPPIDDFEDYVADSILCAGYRKQENIADAIMEEISKRFEYLLSREPCNGDLTSAKKFLDSHWKYIANSVKSDYVTKPPKGEERC